jgi:IS30 family transposase
MRTQKRLTPFDRERILIGLSFGQSPADLARLLGRHRSMITREISRNTRTRRTYSAFAAQKAALQRSSSRRGGRTKLASHPESFPLNSYVQNHKRATFEDHEKIHIHREPDPSHSGRT